MEMIKSKLLGLTFKNSVVVREIERKWNISCPKIKLNSYRGADSDRCRFRQMQIQTDADSDRRGFKQIHIQTDPDRCIAHNHTNTKMNNSRSERCSRQHIKQQIQTAVSDRQQQRVPNRGRRRAAANIHIQIQQQRVRTEVDEEQIQQTTDAVLSSPRCMTR
ncbi:hypothetical protein Tco_1123428 [Tanacetum coccineum]|uniref:Uncharacterized protein n=1 Tax=Tanacetum coccineum TaxID=301880 RepID=A0ABQ5J3C5_9ASTR